MKKIILLISFLFLFSCKETGKISFAVNFPKKETKDYKIKQIEQVNTKATGILEVIIK